MIKLKGHRDNDCARCEKPIGGTAVFLELQISTGDYRLIQLPSKDSQGWFAFHGKCAEKAIQNKSSRTAKEFINKWEGRTKLARAKAVARKRKCGK